jgi:hypothetical protein
LLLGARQRHRHGDQPGLGAIVQVAFHATQGGCGIVDGIGASPFQLHHATLAVGRTQQRIGQPHVAATETPHHPTQQVQRDDTADRQQQVATQRVNGLAKGDERFV